MTEATHLPSIPCVSAERMPTPNLRSRDRYRARNSDYSRSPTPKRRKSKKDKKDKKKKVRHPDPHLWLTAAPLGGFCCKFCCSVTQTYRIKLSAWLAHLFWRRMTLQ
jgi:hypothetical protein